MVSKGPLQWHLQGPDKRTVTVPIDPRFQSNNLISLKEAACASIEHRGVARYICQPGAEGRGVAADLAPQWIARRRAHHRLIPYRIGTSCRCATMVDYLAECFTKVTAFDCG